MTTESAKKCWPWSHRWTKWESHDGISTNKLTNTTRDALVQTRLCTACGFRQIEGVRGR